MSENFWSEDSRYGLIHRSKANNSTCLLVFVHGLFGNCRGTWRQMPEWVLERCGCDIDVVSFDYPSQWWQRTSVSQAADDLRTLLEIEFVGHRQVLFVTHSTGGLVVKQMLKQSFLTLKEEITQQESTIASSNSIWLRSRRVINIAVPHSGGSPFITGLLKVVYLSIYPLLWPFFRLIRFVSQGKKDWGKNDLLTVLRWKNPWLLALEKTFVEQLQLALKADMPSPVVHDIFAKSDLSVPIKEITSEREIYFRGTHGSVKVPRQSADPIVTIVSDIVRRYSADSLLALIDHLLGRIAEVNKLTGVENLIGNDTNTASIGADSERILGGTQEETRDQVVAKVHVGGERPQQIAIVGGAGVGKSTVVRMIAWRLGTDYLAQPGPRSPIPLLLPLQQVNIPTDGQDALSWDYLWNWWEDWIRNLYPDLLGFDLQLELLFRTRAVTVIFDGLDDFLVNHPSYGLSSIVAMLRSVTKRYTDNPRFSIVVAIRSGFHGLQRLATTSGDIYEVRHLTPRQAQHLFPTCKRWLLHVPNTELLELVLTPLILSHFEPDSDFETRKMTQNSIMEQTLRTIVGRSNLVGIRVHRGLVAEIEHILIALVLIAWLFFRENRGEIEVTTLAQEALEVSKRWEKALENQSQSDNVQVLLTGFHLLQDSNACVAILQRTVFVSTGMKSVRFAHRSWLEFLLSEYFARCIKFGYVEDFGVTAFNSHIYRMAGESFQGQILSEDCVQNILGVWRNSQNTYISGNLIAFLAWTQTSVDARGIQLLVDALPEYEPLSRVVLIAGFGYRVLSDMPDDLSAGDFRRALFPKLNLFANPQTSPVDDTITSSLAWCYQKAFAVRFGMSQPEIKWPTINFDDAHTHKALPMICTVKDGQLVLDARSRSLQLAFLTPVVDALSDPNLAIRALHYLYYLIVARKHGVHVFELSQELPQLLVPGCPFEKVIESFTLVPEVLQLYRLYQNIHQQLEAGKL